jgi:predicted dithiol-disulfide oxidoreductase (DUF899 family)
VIVLPQRNIGADAVVASTAFDSQEWLQAADILLARHRTLWLARQWLAITRRRYPGCTVAVSQQRGGRWCLVGLPHGVSVLFVGRRRWIPADAERIGRISYEAWLLVRIRASEEEGR